MFNIFLPLFTPLVVCAPHPPSLPEKTGVLRDIYLSPAGAKSVAPLSRFRDVLFTLLGALPQPSPSPSPLAGGADGRKPAAAVLDGVVVRDVAAFLQVRCQVS